MIDQSLNMLYSVPLGWFLPADYRNTDINGRKFSGY